MTLCNKTYREELSRDHGLQPPCKPPWVSIHHRHLEFLSQAIGSRVSVMHFPRSEATMPGTSYPVSIALRGLRESTEAMPAGYRGKRRNRAVSLTLMWAQGKFPFTYYSQAPLAQWHGGTSQQQKYYLDNQNNLGSVSNDERPRSGNMTETIVITAILYLI